MKFKMKSGYHILSIKEWLMDGLEPINNYETSTETAGEEWEEFPDDELNELGEQYGEVDICDEPSNLDELLAMNQALANFDNQTFKVIPN